jgi:flagellar FliJ protein
MQSILDIKLKMETQAKQNFANARNALDEELQRLETLKKRKAEYEERGRELLEGTLNLKDISENKHAILRMDEFIFTQKGVVKRAEAKLEAAREQLEEVMKERKTHETLKEKVFEAFLMDEKQRESKEIDELTSYLFAQKVGEA